MSLQRPHGIGHHRIEARHCAVFSGDHESACTVRIPTHALAVCRQLPRSRRLRRPDVDHRDSLVVATREHDSGLSAMPQHALHLVLVMSHRLNALQRVEIPQLDRVIRASRSKQLSVHVIPRERHHSARMSTVAALQGKKFSTHFSICARAQRELPFCPFAYSSFARASSYFPEAAHQASTH